LHFSYLRRIARGFYDRPQDNRIIGKPTYPNPHDVIDARARKGKVRVVVDGLTAANDLGLTDAVPARILYFFSNVSVTFCVVVFVRMTLPVMETEPNLGSSSMVSSFLKA
jgi:Family of unknown function (DUF6088)